MREDVIKFLDIETREEATFSLHGSEFYLGKDGKVYESEFDDGAMIMRERPDVGAFFYQFEVEKVTIPQWDEIRDKERNK